MMDDRTKEKQARDDFWDIDRLLPHTPKTRRVSTPSRVSTEAVDVDVPSPVRSHGQESAGKTHTSQPLTYPRADHGGGAYPTHQAEKPDDPMLTYEPEGRLLHTVKVYAWRTDYHYFDQFISDAARYANIKGKEAAQTPFFSYFPQYAQMNRRQLAWYLWWRENVRQGSYPETDYAYILLYVFELLNLPVGGAQAETYRDVMARVWTVYRKAYPQLDHYMCEWLCDYCLIHQLTPPVDILMPALGEIIATARLKEFYLSAMISVGSEDVNLASARILLAYCCQYDYRKSKFAGGEHKALFDTLIPGAIAATFPLIIGEKGEGGLIPMDDSYISRDAYVGALCGYSNKRRIEIAYTSFSRSHDLRFLIGDMVRHVENRIRASLGVRSRLTVHFLTNPMKDALDAWLDPRLPQAPTSAATAARSAPRPAYEALYDLPRTEISLSSADEIERSSWETTRILTEAFGESSPTEDAVPTPQPEEQPSAPVSEPKPQPITATPAQSELLTALGHRVTFLRAVLDGDRAGQSAYCHEARVLPDAVVDEINEITTEHEVFDMVLEDTGDGYAVIPDYRQVLLKLLNGDV